MDKKNRIKQKYIKFTVNIWYKKKQKDLVIFLHKNSCLTYVRRITKKQEHLNDIET